MESRSSPTSPLANVCVCCKEEYSMTLCSVCYIKTNGENRQLALLRDEYQQKMTTIVALKQKIEKEYNQRKEYLSKQAKRDLLLTQIKKQEEMIHIILEKHQLETKQKAIEQEKISKEYGELAKASETIQQTSQEMNRKYSQVVKLLESEAKDSARNTEDEMIFALQKILEIIPFGINHSNITIFGIECPSATSKIEERHIGFVLGCIVKFLSMFSTCIDIPLKHPISFRGSLSTITVGDRDVFPLYLSENLDKGQKALNENIIELCGAQGKEARTPNEGLLYLIKKCMPTTSLDGGGMRCSTEILSDWEVI